MKPHLSAGTLSVGHPVDVASGNLFQDFTDHTLPGRMLLSFRRRYSGKLVGKTNGMFGSGWSSPFEIYLTSDLEGYRMLSEDGEDEIAFDVAEANLVLGARVVNFSAFYELIPEGEVIFVTHWNPFFEDVTLYEFRRGRGPRWDLVAVHNADGRAIRVIRDEGGRVISMEQIRERRGYRLEYNERGRVVQVYGISRLGEVSSWGEGEADKEWLVLRYTYDEQDQLSEMYDAAGHRASYRYDTYGRLVEEETLAGMVFQFRYDRDGRCLETCGPEGFDNNRLMIDPVARITKVTNAADWTTTYQWNENGQVVQKISSLGNVSTTEYDSLGRISAESCPDGATTRYEYGPTGDRVRVTDPMGAVTTYRFNNRHQITEVVDPAGRTWVRHLDNNGRIVGLTLPNGQRWDYTYNAHGDLISISNPVGFSRKLEYNDRGELIRLSDWRGHWTHYEYGEEGDLLAVVNALGGRTTCGYNSLGHLTHIHYADGTERRFVRNVYNQVTEFTDECGNVTRLKYGGCGSLQEVQRPSGSRVMLEWGRIAGQLLAVIDPLGRRQTFIYDSDGRCKSVTDFAGRLTQYEYDADGRVVAIQDAAGKTMQFKHNLVGAVTTVEFDNRLRTTYEYDVCGNLIKANNEDCTVEFKLDILARVVEEKQGDIVIRNEYDTLGRRSRRQSSLGYSTNFEWDPDGNVLEIHVDDYSPIRFRHNAIRNEVARYILDGPEVHLKWDSRGRPVEQVVGRWLGTNKGVFKEGGIAIVRRLFEYDAASNLIGVEEGGRRSVYQYDRDHRITEARHADHFIEEFDYDLADNIIYWVDQNETRCGGGWQYSNANQLVARDGVLYEYDTLGQRIKKREGDLVTTYEWARRGELARVTLPDGSEYRYKYDPFGRRIEKAGPGGINYFVWDGDVVLHEIHEEALDRRSLIHWEYHPLGFTPVTRIENGQQYLCVTDATNLPRELVDCSGTIVWKANYTTYGRMRRQQMMDVDCPARFPGQWYDQETGLYYNRFRYYDPETAQYISRDPLGLAGGLNGYNYIRNPFSWIDPYGLTKLCGHVPEGAEILEDKSPSYVIYKKDSQLRIIFKADEAVTLKGANPGRNYTTDSLAALNENGKVYVHEGRHRTIGAAKGDAISADNGGIPGLPGHLDYEYTSKAASGGKPVKDMTIDYKNPDVPKKEADKIYKEKFGLSTSTSSSG